LNVFRSAVTGSDGSINVGYLSLFWIMIIVLNVIPWMCVFTAIDAFGYDRPFDVRSLGYGVGAVCAGFSTALGALGIFLWGDSRTTPVSTVTTTSTRVQVEDDARPRAPAAGHDSADVSKEDR
jgi:hypothetical protein